MHFINIKNAAAVMMTCMTDLCVTPHDAWPLFMLLACIPHRPCLPLISG